MKTKHLQKIFISSIYAMLILVIFFLFPMGIKAQSGILNPPACFTDSSAVPGGWALNPYCCVADEYVADVVDCKGGWIVNEDGELMFGPAGFTDSYVVAATIEGRFVYTLKELPGDIVELRASIIGPASWRGLDHYLIYDMTRLDFYDVGDMAPVPQGMFFTARSTTPAELKLETWTIEDHTPSGVSLEHLYFQYLDEKPATPGKYAWCYVNMLASTPQIIARGVEYKVYTLHFKKVAPGPLQPSDFGFIASYYGSSHSYLGGNGGMMHVAPVGGTGDFIAVPGLFEYRYPSSVETFAPLAISSTKATISGDFTKGNYAAHTSAPLVTQWPTYDGQTNVDTPFNGPQSLAAFQIEPEGYASDDSISWYGFIYTINVDNPVIDFDTKPDFEKDFDVTINGSPEGSVPMSALMSGTSFTIGGEVFYVVKAPAENTGGTKSLQITGFNNGDSVHYWAFSINGYSTIENFINVGARQAFMAEDCMLAPVLATLPDLCDDPANLTVDNNAYYQGLLAPGQAITYEWHWDDGSGSGDSLLAATSAPTLDIYPYGAGLYTVRVIAHEAGNYPDLDLAFCEADTTFTMDPCGGAFSIVQTPNPAVVCNLEKTEVIVEAINNSTTSAYTFAMTIVPEWGSDAYLWFDSYSVSSGSYDELTGIWISDPVAAEDTARLSLWYTGENIGVTCFDLMHTATIDSVNSKFIPIANRLSDTAYVTITPEPVADQLADVYVCAGDTYGPIDVDGVYTFFDYIITGGGTNLPNGVQMTQIPEFTAKNVDTAALIKVEVIPSYSCAGDYHIDVCEGDTMTFYIHVFPNPPVTVPTEQTFCDGDQIYIDFPDVNGTTDPEYKYYWERIVGEDFGVTGTSGTDTLVGLAKNTGNAPLQALYQVTAYYTKDGFTCWGATDNFIITVNPTPVIAPVADMKYCNGDNVSAYVFTGDVADASYHWTQTNYGTGTDEVIMPGLDSTGYDILPAFMAINTTSDTIVLNYEVYAYYAYANGAAACISDTMDFSITIYPGPWITPIVDVTYCPQVTTNIPAFQCSIPGAVFAWEKVDGPYIGETVTYGTGNFINFSTVNDATGFNDNAPKTATYKVVATVDGYCVSEAVYFSITVNPYVRVNPVVSQEVCEGGMTAEFNFTGPVTGTTYYWSHGTPGIGVGTVGWGNIPPFVAENPGTLYPYAIAEMTVTAHYGSCTGSSTQFTLRVNPIPEVQVIYDQVYCDGTVVQPIDLLDFAELPGFLLATGVDIDWEMVGGSPSLGLSQPFGKNTFPEFEFTAENHTSTVLQAVVKATPVYRSGTDLDPECAGEPKYFTVSVMPELEVDQPSNITVCHNTAVPDINFSGSAVDAHYYWMATSATDATAIGMAISGNDFIPAFTAHNYTTSVINVTVTVSAYMDIDGKSCTSATPDVTFTISVTPEEVTVDPVDDIIICAGEPVADIPLDGSADIYYWEASSNGTLAGMGALAGTLSGTSVEIPGFLAANATGAPIVVEIKVTPAINNGGFHCYGSPIYFNIIVDPIPSADQIMDIEVCAGAPVSDIVFTGTVPGTTYTWYNSDPDIGLASYGVGNISWFIATNTTDAPIEATITVYPTFGSGDIGDYCESADPMEFTITVNPEPKLKGIHDMAFCYRQEVPTIELFYFVEPSYAGGVSYVEWEFIGGNTCGMWEVKGVDTIGGFTATNYNSTLLQGVIKVTPMYGDCAGEPKYFTITVMPELDIDQPSDIKVCNNTAIPDITFSGKAVDAKYEWTATPNAASIGMATSGHDFIPAFTAHNHTSSIINVTVAVFAYMDVHTVRCKSDTIYFTISVTPEEVIVDPIDDVIVCAGESVPDIIIGGTGDQYYWEASSNAALIGMGALAGTISGTVPTFDGLLSAENNTSAPIVVEIKITPAINNGGFFCYGSPIYFNIIVDPIPDVNYIADIDVCAGETIGNIIFTGSVPGTTYTWMNDNMDIGLGSIGTGDILSFTAMNPADTAIVANIEVTPMFAGSHAIGDECVGSPMTVAITVYPTPVINPVSSITVCDSTNVKIAFTSSMKENVEYAWYVDNNANAMAIGMDLAKTPTDSLNFLAVNDTDNPITVWVTVTPVAVATEGGCAGEPTMFSITVSPAGVMLAIQDQDICVGEMTAEVNFGALNAPTGTVFHWFNDNPGIGLPDEGVGNIPSFKVLTDTTATITVTAEFSNGSAFCNGDSTTFTITGYEIPVMVPVSSLTVCDSTEVNIVFSSSMDSVTYNWYVDNLANAKAIGWDLATVTGSGNIKFMGVNNTANPITVWVTVTPSAIGSIAACTGEPFTFSITVSPEPDMTGVFSQEKCVGEQTDAINLGAFNAPEGTVYHWWMPDPAHTAIGLEAEGFTQYIPPFTVLAAPITAVIKVTAIYNNASAFCNGDTIEFTITSYERPVMTPIEDITVCDGDFVDVPVFQATIEHPTTYKWRLVEGVIPGVYYKDSAWVALELESIGQFHDFLAVNTGATVLTAKYGVTPNTGAHCDGDEVFFTITVNPTPIVAEVADKNYCHGENVAAYTFTGNVEGATYYWVQTNFEPQDMIPGDGYNEFPAFTAVNTSSLPIILEYMVTPSFENNGVVCYGDPIEFSITIDPAVEVGPMPDLYFCDGDTTDYISFGGTAAEYRWVQISGDVINDMYEDPYLDMFTGDVDVIPPFAVINKGNTLLEAVIKVTPYAANGVCFGEPVYFSIFVKPTPTVDTPADQTLCAGERTDDIIFTGNTEGTIYRWTVATTDDANMGLAASGTGNIGAFTTVNATNAPIVATITVTPEFMMGLPEEACKGKDTTFTITVNPVPVMDPISSVTVCDDMPVKIDFTSSMSSNVKYEWYVDNVDNAIAIGMDSIPTPIPGFNFTATNTTANPITVVVTVTPWSMKDTIPLCAGEPTTFSITVSPIGIMNQVVDQVVCVGDMTAEVDFSALNAPIGTVFHWTNNNKTIGLDSVGTGNIPSFEVLAATEATITVFAEFSNGSAFCSGDSIVFKITGLARPVMNPIEDITACVGDTINYVTFGSTGVSGATKYAWRYIGGYNEGLATLQGIDTFPTFTATNSGTTVLTAVYGVKAYAMLDGKQYCEGDEIFFTITVNPTPDVDTPPDAIYCNGDQIPAYTFTGNTPGATYEWYLTNNSDFQTTELTEIPTAGWNIFPAFTATNLRTNNTDIVLKYAVFSMFEENGVVCKGDSTTFQITIHPTPEVTPLPDMYLCDGTLTGNIELMGGAEKYYYMQVSGDVITENLVDLFTGDYAIDTASVIIPFIPSFKVVNTGNTVLNAVIRVTPWTADGYCSGEPMEFTITVIPNADMYDVIDQVVCVNDWTAEVNFSALNAPEGTIFHWTNDNTSIGLDSIGVGNIPSFKVLANVKATITVFAEFGNGGGFCSGDSITFTITGVDVPTMFPIENISVCYSDEELDVPPFISDATNAVYDWRFYDGTNVRLDGKMVGQGNMDPFFLVNPGTTQLIGIYAVKVTEAGFCESEEIFFTITVNPVPEADKPGDATYCSGTQVPEHTFTGNTPNATYYWLQTNYMLESVPELPQEGWNILPAFLAHNTTNYPIVLEYEVTAYYEYAGEVCEGTTEEFTITINPEPEVEPVPDQILCAGEETEAVVFTGTAYEYRWIQISGPVITKDPTISLFEGGVDVLPAFETVNNGSAAVTAIIKVTPWSEDGYCAGEPIEFTIMVKPTPMVYQVPSQKLCAGQPTQSIIFEGDTEGTIFHWTCNAPQIGMGEASGTGNILSFITVNHTNAPIVATIEVTPEFKGDGGNTCDGEIMTFTITVNPIPSVNPMPNLAYCKTAEVDTIKFTGSVEGAIYEWVQISGDVITNDLNLFAGGFNFIPKFTTVDPGNDPLTATIKVTPYTGDTLCDGGSIEFTISVISTPTVEMPTQFADQTYCEGTELSIPFIGSAPGTIYKWEVSTVPVGMDIGLPSDGTGDILIFTTANDTNNPILTTIKVTPMIVQGSDTCKGDVVTFSFTINPTPVMNPVGDKIYCNASGEKTITFTSDMTSNVLYKWTVNNATNATNIGMGGIISGVNGTTQDIVFTPNNGTTTPITVVVTVIPYTPFTPACDGEPVIFTITVDPTPGVSPVTSQDVCAGDWTAGITFGGNVAGTQFQWTNNRPDIGLAPNGWDYIDPFKALNTTTDTIIATITVKPIYSTGGDPCPNSNYTTFTITVYPVPIVEAIFDMTYCADVDVDGFDFVSTIQTGEVIEHAFHTWTQVEGPYIGTASSGTDNFPDFTTVNYGVTPVTAKYKVTSTIYGMCESAPVFFTITVNPTPHLDPVVNKVYCSNESVPMYPFTGTVEGAIYTWSFVEGDFIGLVPQAGTGIMPPFITVNNATDHVLTAKYKVTVTTNDGVICGGEIQEFTISVLPNGTVTNLVNIEVCHNDWIDIPMFEGVATSWEWSFEGGSHVGLEPNSGEGQFPSFRAENTGSTQITALYKVTPYYELDGVKCEGTPGFFSITVNPKPILNTVQSSVVYCEGTPVPAYTFSGTTLGATYRWQQVDGPSIGVPASGTGVMPSFIAQNGTDDLITATFEAWAEYPNSNGGVCTSEIQTFTITILPAEDIDINAVVNPTAYCDGDLVYIRFDEGSNISPTSLMNVRYEWNHVGGDNIGSAMNGSTILTFTATNTGNTKLEAQYTVTPILEYQGYICTGTTYSFTLTVYPQGTITLTGNGANNSTYRACDNADIVDITYTTTQAGLDLVYTLTFAQPALDAGFRDITTFTDLPKDVLAVNLPANVAIGMYEAVLTVRAKVSTLNYCIAEYPITIDVKKFVPMLAEFDSFEVDACDDSGLTLTVNITPADAVATYEWYHNGNLILGANSATYSKYPVNPNDDGEYYVVVTGSSICGGAVSSTVQVKVHQAGLIEQKWDDVLYVDNSRNTYDSYQWYRIVDGTRVPIDGAHSQYFTEDPMVGEYAVDMYNAKGQLVASSCPFAPVLQPKNVITIYPNPVSQGGTLTIFMDMDRDKIADSRIAVYDMVGKQIALKVVDGKTTHVTMEVVPGAYVVRITSATGETMKSEKVIVR